MPRKEAPRHRGESEEVTLHRPDILGNPTATAAWFAGVLEIGAIASIVVAQYVDKGGIPRLKTQPFIEIHSSSDPMLDKLYETYGGMRKPRFWNKGGKVAAEIVAATSQFTVARHEHAIAMQNWLNAETIEEQIAIARDLQQKEWQQLGDDASAYEELLTNPAFVAGILDSRGYIATRPSKYFHTLAIEIRSKNTALLKAIESKFGGTPRITSPAGTQVDNRVVVFETKVDSHELDLLGSDAIELARFASGFLQTPLPMGWEYQRSIEVQEEKAELARRIAEHVRNELQLLQAGEIPQLSTDTVLSDKFTIGRSTVSQYLAEVLTPDEQKARLGNIRKFAKRSINALVAHQIAAYIEKEVLAVQEGRSDRISYSEELADTFGVKVRALYRHVIPYLDPALQNARSGILRSQVTRERNNVYWQNRT